MSWQAFQYSSPYACTELLWLSDLATLIFFKFHLMVTTIDQNVETASMHSVAKSQKLTMKRQSILVDRKCVCETYFN
jgi:hypothetical protein